MSRPQSNEVNTRHNEDKAPSPYLYTPTDTASRTATLPRQLIVIEHSANLDEPESKPSKKVEREEEQEHDAIPTEHSCSCIEAEHGECVCGGC